MARAIAGWTLAVAALAAGLAYICDSLYIRHKMTGANSSEAFGNVQFYPATKLKNGKLDIYLESPENEVCIHALFPHYGYNPCWYAKRNTVHVVAKSIGADGFSVSELLDISRNAKVVSGHGFSRAASGT
ncbi:MAG TPA: hypothetical protein VLW83_05370 [Candidatus Acidoferrales bacterium]|nr:hypothetical protein [Candidatus Acidoferrales bacterium]